MRIKLARTKLSVVLAFGFLTFFATSVAGQIASQQSDALKKLLSIQVSAWGESSNKPAATATPETVAKVKLPIVVPTPEIVSTASAEPAAESTKKKGDIEDEIAAIKAENAAVREQLRRMEEGQKILIEQLDRLRRKLEMEWSYGKPRMTHRSRSC